VPAQPDAHRDQCDRQHAVAEAAQDVGADQAARVGASQQLARPDGDCGPQSRLGLAARGRAEGVSVRDREDEQRGCRERECVQSECPADSGGREHRGAEDRTGDDGRRADRGAQRVGRGQLVEPVAAGVADQLT
jgi:hypothetical protein